MVQALLAAAALIAVATAVGVILRLRDGKARPGPAERIRPADVALPADAFGGSATLLQFSTATCSRCPAQRRLLGAVAGETPGVRHAEVDLTNRIDLANRYHVLQTPTTFVLDPRGRVAVRIPGAATRATVLAALAAAGKEPA